MAEGQEQNRSEQATPFKLSRARQKGMVARGQDLGYVAGLIGLAAFMVVAGAKLLATLANEMRSMLSAGIISATDPGTATSLAARSVWPVIKPVALFGGTVICVVIFVEIVQLQGLIFSATPLKPDFSRLNPAKGLKRLLSARMLKEAAKSIAKLTTYAIITYLAVRGALAGASVKLTDAQRLVEALDRGATRLLVFFILAAAALSVIDQVLARGEFAKQMRMSKREVTREHKEREGDPRLKTKRKQIHAAFAKQAKALHNLPGSDLLLVNPRHLAIALVYKPGENTAPVVTALGADRHALQLKAAARRLGIPVFEARSLVRNMFKNSEMGREISSSYYHAVAEFYFKLGDMRHA